MGEIVRSAAGLSSRPAAPYPGRANRRPVPAECFAHAGLGGPLALRGLFHVELAAALPASVVLGERPLPDPD